MKNIVRALVFISISLVALNCTNDEQIPVQGKVQFALAVTSSSADGGRILSQSFPDGSYISLSIETASGASVYSLKKVELIKLGGGYITSPLALTEGSYRLTDFFVMSEDGEVLYATPKEGSPLAGLVSDPLPIHFSITPDGVVNLSVQVVDADQQTPEDFGYVSFGVEVVESDFSVSIFTSDNNTLSLTSASLRLYQGTDLVYTQSLLAKVNSINFKGDPNSSYTLVVEKEGYTIKTKEYTLEDLVDELNGMPLVFTLSPALTFSVLIKEPSLMEFGLRGAGNLDIDWGDGTVEHVFMTSNTGTELSHEYEQSGRYYVNFTGSLASISDYQFYDLDPTVNAMVTWQTIETVDITRLSELKRFVMQDRESPEEINFALNSKLLIIWIPFTTISHIDISNNKLLVNLVIWDTKIVHPENPNSLANAIDIIDDLSQNAITNNVVNGSFLYADWVVEGLLPNDSKAKLINLKENYGWRIH